MATEPNIGFDGQRSQDGREAWCRTYARVWAQLSTVCYDKKAVEKAADEHWHRNPKSDPVQVATLAAGLQFRLSIPAGAEKTPHAVSSPRPDQSSTGIGPPQPMASSARQVIVFASGFALAAAIFIGAWMALRSDSLPAPRKNVAPLHSTAQGAVQLAACSLQPVVAAAGETDGKLPVQVDVSKLMSSDIEAFIVLGRDATVAGRPRDAEVAFLMSCRVADNLKGEDSIESADAKYELGSHYSKVALGVGSAIGASRAELLRRAELFYSESLQVYLLKYGEDNEKSRLATEGLASVRQALARVQPVQLAVMPKLATGGDGAKVKKRRVSPVAKECPEAVATLGLCNRDK